MMWTSVCSILRQDLPGWKLVTQVALVTGLQKERLCSMSRAIHKTKATLKRF
jgi:hypothetical protein